MVARLWMSETGSDAIWREGADIDLSERAVRHIQVLRMQPGEHVRLFTGAGGEWLAEVLSMGRRDATVRLLSFAIDSCELPAHITLAIGMPANDRMDALVEKATELGVSAIQPLVCARSVLRLEGERAAKKVAHWQSVAIAACEQSGRTHVPIIHAVQPFSQWLPASRTSEISANAAVLSFTPQQSAFDWMKGQLDKHAANQDVRHLLFLSGPEGGLAPEEEAQAVGLGYHAVGLGPRVLRADTAPLMALSLAAALFESWAAPAQSCE